MALCDDFESSATGSGPDVARWVMDYPNCNNNTANSSAVIDTAQAHSGSKSIKIATGSGGYCDHVFIKSNVVASMGDTVFGRFFMRSSQALADGHVTFMALCDAAEAGSGCTTQTNVKDLRMGGQSKILMWNREFNDSTLPALSPTGISLSSPIQANTWYCVEFGITQSTGTLQTWLDGKALAGLQIDGTSTPDVDSQWLQQGNWRPQLKNFKLGWEYYGGGPNTLWFDDVALHTSRIGCGT